VNGRPNLEKGLEIIKAVFSIFSGIVWRGPQRRGFKTRRRSNKNKTIRERVDSNG